MAVIVYLANGGTMVKLPSGEYVSEEEWAKRQTEAEQKEVVTPEEPKVPKKRVAKPKE